MIARLLFGAVALCVLGSRPEVTGTGRRAGQEAAERAPAALPGAASIAPSRASPR